MNLFRSALFHVKLEFMSNILSMISVYKKFFLKTKIKSFGDAAAEFHNKEIPKVGFNHTWVAVISLDPALKKDENY